MADRKTLEDIVHRFYERRAEGDQKALMAFAAPGFSFRMVASGCIANAAQLGRAACGPEMLPAMVKQLVTTWDMAKTKTERLYVDGDTVLAYRTGIIRHVPSGKEVETEYIYRFTFDGEKLIDIT